MPGRFPYKKLTKYPHMKPEDVKVWERLLEEEPSLFDTCDYDFALGKGAPTNPDHPEEIQFDHTILTQKKVDVIGYVGNDVYVIEVKPIADMRALGQILTYFELYTAEYKNEGNVYRMVVCGGIERELDTMFQRNDIIIKEVSTLSS